MQQGAQFTIFSIAYVFTFNPANFFSFFTIESNIFAAVILLIGALAGQNTQSRLAIFRGAATLYMIITGIVFALLLSGIEGIILTAVPWDNIVLHYIMPIVMLIDWVVDPPKNQIQFKRAALWLIYPLLYVGYSLIRGHVVGWYPYPFLNPVTNGYGSVAITSLGIAILAVCLTLVLMRVKSWGHK